ncbi:helix-turn-helix transcriptional regulator [Paenibacillus borealis]|uniref:helix-turn-helix transcriptional regulator n=1 Tax=Paenibacillus borealis TaxID=160799 RepID=UPI000AC485BB|nr:helix-turn-helix transcriptional regulator [Paenibacillus borealis]
MIELTTRQLQIIEIVKKRAPITGDQIAESLGLSRPTIRGDLSILVMLEYIDAKPKVGYFPGTKAAARHNSRGLLQDTKVSDIQVIPVIIRENVTIQDAVVTLFLQDVGTLIICGSDGKLSGVASRKDFLKVTLGNPGAVTMPVSMVMTRQPKIVTVSPDDTVLDAAQRMIYHEVDSLPVVVPGSGEGSGTGLDVVGRLTKTSIVKLLLELEAKG